jgi:hypothetical protein
LKIRDINLNDIGQRAFLAFVFFTPLFFHAGLKLGNQMLRLGQEQFYQLGVTCLFAICLFQNTYLALSLLWVAFLYAYHSFPPMSGLYLMNLFMAGLLYEVAHCLTTKVIIDKLFKVLLWIGVINILYMAVQLFGFEWMFLTHVDKVFASEPVGFFGLKAFMGMFFAALIPIACYYNPLIALLLFLPIFLSETSAAMAGGVVAYLFCLFYYARKFFIPAVCVLCILAGLYIANDSKANMMTDRFHLWRVSLTDAVKHPIVGWGPDSFRSLGESKPFVYFKNYRTNQSVACKFDKNTGTFVPPKGFRQGDEPMDPWDHPHNEFISIFYELGLIPIFILLCLLRDIQRRFRCMDNRQVAIVGYFLAILCLCVAHFPLHVARIGYLVPIMLGVYYKITERSGYL